MPALIVLLVIVLIIAVVLTLRITLDIEYKNDVKLSVRVLLLNFKLLPKKKKRVNYKTFTAKKLRRLLKKDKDAELKKQKKKDEKRKLKERKKAENLKKKELENKNKKLGYPQEKKRTLSENLDIVKLILESVSEYFGKGIHVKVTRIRITVASDDAAKTAVLYGAVSASVSWILEFLEQKAHLKYKAEGDDPENDVSVSADFTAQKPTADVKLSLRVHLWPLVTTGVGAIFKLLSSGNLKSKKIKHKYN